MRSSLYRLLLALAPAVPLAAQEQATAITNVTVIPMDRERTLLDQTVIVRGDRIVEVGRADMLKAPAGARVIDGRGKFLLPGMAEMHGHIPPGAGATDANISKVLAYYALNGVTFVRGMLGDPKHLPWRDKANRGEILSPTIITTRPLAQRPEHPDGRSGDQGGHRAEGRRLRPHEDPPRHPARGLRLDGRDGTPSWASASPAMCRSRSASWMRCSRGSGP